MRKPKRQIGLKRANKLMHDLGLRTPEDIQRQFGRLSAYGKMSQSGSCGLVRPAFPILAFVLIRESGNHCGCCHEPIEPGNGISFGRPLSNGIMSGINVCESCVKLAQTFLVSAKEGLI